jgi:hypothetical protein
MHCTATKNSGHSTVYRGAPRGLVFERFLDSSVVWLIPDKNIVDTSFASGWLFFLCGL